MAEANPPCVGRPSV
uniref:Cad n=1 Tax=Arundo donax TaxID=35708 RepID=A0A0A9DWG2_ARUDO